jgi:hypothetical protein
MRQCCGIKLNETADSLKLKYCNQHTDIFSYVVCKIYVSELKFLMISHDYKPKILLRSNDLSSMDDFLYRMHDAAHTGSPVNLAGQQSSLSNNFN